MTMRIEQVENGFVCYREGHLPYISYSLRELSEKFEQIPAGSNINMNWKILHEARALVDQKELISAIKLIRSSLFPGKTIGLREAKELTDTWR